MSSTPQTSGFQVSVMPSVQLADPRLFTGLAPFGAGLSSGVNMGAQLQNIALQRADLAAKQDAMAYERSLRPMRQQLADIQLAQAADNKRLTDLKLQEAGIEAKFPTTKQTGTWMDLDDNGNLVEYANVTEYDPRTGELNEYTGRPVKTVKTAEQLAQEKMAATALADYRTNMGNAAGQRAATAQDVAEWKRQNPAAKVNTYYDEGDNVYQRAVNPTTGATLWETQIMLPNGQPAKRPQNQTSFQLMMGGAAAPGAAAAPGLTFDQFNQSFQESAPKAAPVAGGAPVPVPPAEAAKLAPGTRFFGVDGQWHIRK